MTLTYIGCRSPIESGSLQGVICLLEALSSSSISGSIELARTLLNVLQAVSYTHVPSRSDADYVEQLIISILETVVASIDVSVLFVGSPLCSLLLQSPVSPVALQVDVLVRLIGGKPHSDTSRKRIHRSASSSIRESANIQSSSTAD